MAVNFSVSDRSRNDGMQERFIGELSEQKLVTYTMKSTA